MILVKDHLYLVAIKERYRLNHPQSQKKTYHLVLDLKGLGITYGVGDCIGIYPTNDRGKVAQLLSNLGATGKEIVLDRSQTPHALEDYLLHKANLQRLPLDPLPSDPQTLVNKLPPLLPRLYSIASSMAEVGEEAHLTIALTEYEMAGIAHVGLCSHYLTHLAPLHTPILPIYVQKERGFTLPPSDKPMIMIGPGTGIAPFRGFLQERIRQGHLGDNWLFFGERHIEKDFYYGAYFSSLQASGKLRLDLAFSRDQAHKIYVQHRMLENSKDFFNWLENGAYLYVCGDAERMAKDVEKTLLEIVMTEGKLPIEGAREYVKRLRREKRYLRDVY